MKVRTTIPKLFIILLLSLLQKSYGERNPKLDSLNNLYKEIYHQYPDSAFLILEKGIVLAQREKDSLMLGTFYQWKALGYQHKSQKLALENFFKAKRIFEAIGHKRKLVLAYMGLSDASIHEKQKVNLAREALNLARSIQDTELIAYTLNSLGIIMESADKNNGDSAIYLFEKALQMAMTIPDSNTIAMIYNNIGMNQNNKKDYFNALQSYYNSMSISKVPDHILNAQANLMTIYFHLNEPDSALHYYHIIKNQFERRPFLEGLYYKNFSEYYARHGDKDKAYTFLKKADSIKDMLAKEEDASALNLLELEYEAKVKENQMNLLNAEIEKAENMRYFLISILIIILTAGGVISYQYKQKTRKKREALVHKKRRAEAEKRLMAEKLQHAELQSRYLNSQLKYTSHELAYIAAGKVQNRELLLELKEYVEETYRKKDLGDIKNNLRDLNMQLVQLLNKDRNEQQKIIEKAEDVNMSLIYGLKEKFPGLSENDTKLLMLLLLKFNSKEIGSMYNIEERSAVRRRYRLRKKLGIKKGETFEDFFERVLPDIELVKGFSREEQNGKQH